MATDEDYEALKAGFRMLTDALRDAAFSMSNGFVYSGPLADVVNEVSPIGAAERAVLKRAALLV